MANVNYIDDAILKQASETIKSKNRFTYIFWNLFFSRDQIPVLFLTYAFFRWLDDMVDENSNSIEFSKLLIDREVNNLVSLYAGIDVVPEYDEENYLIAVVKNDLQKEEILRKIIEDFFSAISWDLRRRNSIPEQCELNRYSYLLGQSYSQGMVIGLGYKSYDPRFIHIGEYCGVAAHLTHLMRDLFIDLDLGYINISKEDVDKYHIDFKANPVDFKNQLKPWFIETINRTFRLYNKGMNFIPLLPSFKAKVTFLFMNLHYLRILYKIKAEWS